MTEEALTKWCAVEITADLWQIKKIEPVPWSNDNTSFRVTDISAKTGMSNG